MAKEIKAPNLLSWTQFVPISEGQDPLGLNLRVNARLAGQLFYCITSITPRARYYTFLLWAFARAQKMSEARTHRERMRILEKAFALGCVASHGGQACEDGRLVGITEMSNWIQNESHDPVDLVSLKFAKNPAYDAYWASLVNLGMFKALEPVEELESDDEAIVPTEDNVEFSDLGLKAVQAYEEATKEDSLGLRSLNVPIGQLEALGNAGCLCRMRHGSPDQLFLRDVFFNRVRSEVAAHTYRRNTLLLIMQLAEQLSEKGMAINETTFGEAIYFGSVRNDDGDAVNVVFDRQLNDVINRWKMFYSHYYLSAALESLLVCVVGEVNRNGLRGTSLSELIEQLSGPSFNKGLAEILKVKFTGNLSELSLAQIYACTGLESLAFDNVGSEVFYDKVTLLHPLSESSLEHMVSKKTYWGSPEGLAAAGILAGAVIIRFLKYESEPYGNWLANAVTGAPHENVTVPVVLKQLRVKYEDPWRAPLGEILYTLLDYYVVRLHQLLAYQKSGSFFYADEGQIVGRGKRYDAPAYQNGRLPSALLILKDLGLLESRPENNRLLRLTSDGKAWLSQELMGEISP